MAVNRNTILASTAKSKDLPGKLDHVFKTREHSSHFLAVTPAQGFRRNGHQRKPEGTKKKKKKKPPVQNTQIDKQRNAQALEERRCDRVIQFGVQLSWVLHRCRPLSFTAPRAWRTAHTANPSSGEGALELLRSPHVPEPGTSGDAFRKVQDSGASGPYASVIGRRMGAAARAALCSLLVIPSP